MCVYIYKIYVKLIAERCRVLNAKCIPLYTVIFPHSFVIHYANYSMHISYDLQSMDLLELKYAAQWRNTRRGNKLRRRWKIKKIARRDIEIKMKSIRQFATTRIIYVYKSIKVYFIRTFLLSIPDVELVTGWSSLKQ